MDQARAVLFELVNRGIDVRGEIVSRERYEALRAIEDPATSLHEIALSEDSLGEQHRRQFFSKALGLLRRPTLSRPVLRNPSQFSANQRRAFLDTILSHNVITLLGQAMKGEIRFAPNVALTSYFLAYFSNFESILRLKGEGKALQPADKENNAVEIDVKAGYVLVANAFEELLVNILFDLTLRGGLDFGELIERSLVFGISKTTVDRICARLELKRNRLRKLGDEEMARELESEIFRRQVFFFNRVIPALRTLKVMTRSSSHEKLIANTVNALQMLSALPTVVDEVRRFQFERDLNSSASSECSRMLLRLAKN